MTTPEELAHLLERISAAIASAPSGTDELVAILRDARKALMTSTSTSQPRVDPTIARDINSSLSSVILNLEMSEHAIGATATPAISTEAKYLVENLRAASNAAEEIRAILRSALVIGE